MSETEKKRCSEMVSHSGVWSRVYQCSRFAKVERDGKWYCAQHDPVAIKLKREEQDRKWREKWDREAKEAKEESAKAAEQKRRADLFPELLEALEKVRGDINWMMNSEKLLNPDVFEYVDTAIAKARGTSSESEAKG